MTHDPLCERPNGPNFAMCYCDLIARVREDEQTKRDANGFWPPAFQDGYTAALRDAVASVGAAGPDPCVVMCGDCRLCNEWRGYYRAVAAIEALAGES